MPPRRTLIYIGLALVVIGGALHALVKVHNTNEVTAAPMRFEIASTTEAQERGLGGRAEIPDDFGMLFVFPEDSRTGFWMKDMLAPIDIIWLNDAGVIQKVDASVATSTYPTTFYPPSPTRYVLETRAGYAKDHGWKEGTQVALPSY
jgi:uncharacterized membrane protein (UPF0127 family)